MSVPEGSEIATMEFLLKFIAVILLSVVSPVLSRPSYEITERQTTDRLVFCHFMVGLLRSDPGLIPAAIFGVLQD